MRAMLCPTCGVADVKPYVAFECGFLYMSENCGYIGPVVITVEPTDADTFLKDPVFATEDYDFTLIDVMLLQQVAKGPAARKKVLNGLGLASRHLDDAREDLTKLLGFELIIEEKKGELKLTDSGKAALTELEETYRIDEVTHHGLAVTKEIKAKLAAVYPSRFTAEDIAEACSIDEMDAQLLIRHLVDRELVREVSDLGIFAFTDKFAEDTGEKDGPE